MVANKIIHASNAQISAEPGLTFVFAGATAGIGLSTLKAFARRAVRPTAYIIGRTKAKFQVHLVSADRNPVLHPGLHREKLWRWED